MAVWVSGLEITPSVTVALFDRTSRRVVLSQACRAVLGQARRAVTESDRAVSLARLAARGDRHPHWKKAFQASSAYFLWPLTLR